MPTPESLEELFVRPLEQAGISYMVSGSVAAMYDGEPRLTLDVDMAASLDAAAAPKLAHAFESPDYDCPPLDVIRVEMARPQRGHFNIIHLPTGTAQSGASAAY